MTKTAKITLTTISVTILIAGIVVCVLRWKAWFGNQPEKEYAVSAEPHNILLSYGEKASVSRIISWRADTLLLPSEVQLLSWNSRDTCHFPAEGTLIRSRAGKAAFYRVRIDSIAGGNYSYRCCTGGNYSEWHNIFISGLAEKNRMQEFLVFGDVQDKTGEASTAMFNTAFANTARLSSATQLAGVMFVGDIIERPTDAYWQVFFSAMTNRLAEIPVIASTGNHEYLKGVKKTLDTRWTHVFGNPQNGPSRFSETTYFIDFPHARIIVIDTDALQLFSDYTVIQTWLRRVLKERLSAWNIVLMHHPVYAAGKGRDNPLIRLAFRSILKDADVVFCGHDHNYLRRTEATGKPVYILTNSSEKFYTPKDSISADRHAAYLRFYEDMKIYPDSLRIDTWELSGDTVFDRVVVKRQ